MPAKNTIKQYKENGYYHIYNRGVEKRLTFQDSQDYSVFLSYLKEYLSPKNEQELREKLSNLETSYKEKDKIIENNNEFGAPTFVGVSRPPLVLDWSFAPKNFAIKNTITYQCPTRHRKRSSSVLSKISGGGGC